MNAQRKLRDQGSELTRLKKLWRDSLAPDAKEFWRAQFISELSQAEIRKLIHARLKINLTYDGQLNAFRDWELDQRELDTEAERQEEDERRALAENPNWTIDQAREEVLKKAYKRASARGDFKLGLATVDRDLNAQTAKTKAKQEEAKIELRRGKLKLDERHISILERKAEAFDRAQAALTTAKTSKGGVTKATMDKIIAELNLM